MSGDLVNCWRPEKVILSRIQYGFRVGKWKMRKNYSTYISSLKIYTK